MALLEPIEKVIDGKTYILSKFPAVAGREIAAVYSAAQSTMNTDYKRTEDIMLKLMCYVAVDIQNGVPLQLTTRSLVDNHVNSWETLVKIEREMIDYNSGFLAKG